MSREDIMKMKAGREMDALVAEKVMEWKPWLEQRGENKYIIWQKPDRQEPWFGSRDWERNKERYEPFDGIYDPHKHIEVLDFKPSTDIAAAWEVVENMPTMKGHIGKTMLHELSSCRGDRWCCVFCSDFGYSEYVYAPTPTLAICRAALLAVMK